MKTALFQTHVPGSQVVLCELCPHNCRLKEGQTGICRVRRNEMGNLVSENYGRICSLNFDPVEKKPLYHFYPGSMIFSLGSVGCNLHCQFCQNHEISQCGVRDFPGLKSYSPDEILEMASKRKDNIGIAYTYNEPLVWYEFMKDVAIPAKEKGLKNVMVTNGFINPGPLKELFGFIDAFSVDLKAFEPFFFRKFTASELEPVLEVLKMIRASGRHLEVTNLVITGTNDDPVVFEHMAEWIAAELGENTILHISRFFPQYKMDRPPTPVATLTSLYEIARKYLKFVYKGNVHGDENQHTCCPDCGTLLIERFGYHVSKTGLTGEGKCRKCGYGILGC